MGNCTFCENIIADGSKFCTACGQQTAAEILLCSQCGTRNEILAKFCVACGSSLEDTSFSITEIPSTYEEPPLVENLSEDNTNTSPAPDIPEEDYASESEPKEQKATRLARAKTLLENLVNRNSDYIEESGDIVEAPKILKLPNPIMPARAETSPLKVQTESLHELHNAIEIALADELTKLKTETDDIEYIQFTCDRIKIRDVAAYSPFRLPEKVNV